MSDELKDDWQAIRITDYYSHNIIAPSSWAKVLFSDICRVVGGSQPPKECFINEPREGYIRLIQIRDYKTDKFATYIPIELAKRFCNKEDIMIGRYGPPIFQILRGLEGAYNVALMKAEPNTQLVVKEFLYYFLKTSNLFNYIAAASLRTAGQDGVRKDHLDNYPVFVPPLNEQKRIVAAIASLKNRSQKARSALAAIPELCDKFRQSVLAAAFRGDLTADWREQNPDVEPASVLLERILQNNQFKKKSRFGNSAELPTEGELEELPEGWCWATFEQISERVTVGHVGSMKDEYLPAGIPFLRSQNVRENRFEPEGLQFISKEFHKKLSKSSLQPGDLVVVRSGSVGTACVIPDSLKEANCSDLVIVKQPKGINPHYGSYYMNSVARSHVNEQQVGVALIHFNTKSMALLPIPVAPYEEQEEIVQRVQELFKSAALIEQQYEETKAKLEHLDRSILAKAFRGELVEQNPNDEPASVLLERIRAEREQQAQGKAKKPGTKGQRTIKAE